MYTVIYNFIQLQIDDEEDNNSKEKTRLYVPPRVHAMPYGE